MTCSGDVASRAQVEAFWALLEDPGATLYTIVQALEQLSDAEIALTGKSRAQLAGQVLRQFPAAKQ